MTGKWFRRYHWIYLPVSWPGFLVVLLFMIFNVQVFSAIDRSSHSVSDTLYGIFPYLIGSLVILFWIAANTGGRIGKRK